MIFGTAGPTKQEYLRKIGVDHRSTTRKAISCKAVRKFAPDGIEMVMDPIGGKSFAQSQECLGPTGRLVVYGFSAAAGPDGKRSWLRGLKALLADAEVSSAENDEREPRGDRRESGALCRRAARCCASELDELFRMYEAGKIKPVIGKTFPLADAAAGSSVHPRAEEYRQSDSDGEVARIAHFAAGRLGFHEKRLVDLRIQVAPRRVDSKNFAPSR